MPVLYSWSEVTENVVLAKSVVSKSISLVERNGEVKGHARE